MKLSKIWLPISSLMVVAILALSSYQSINAVGGNGLRVSPVRSDLTIAPSKTQTITINVTNVTTQPANFQAIINDFMANPNETGNPAIILDPSQSAPSHGLKKYIDPIKDFNLLPGQQKGISVTIRIPKDVPGGGYFGAVRFAPAGTNNSTQTVNLAGSVGSLILVKVPGDIKDQLSIASFDARSNDSPSTFFTNNKKISAVVRFQNSGNVQEAPFGKVVLKNRSGKVINSYEVNSTDPPGVVLPDSIRKYPVPLDKVGKFGKFKLEGNFGYGSNGQPLSASTTFYVIPKLYIILFILVVLLALFVIFGMPRLVKAYNRSVLRRAGRR